MLNRSLLYVVIMFKRCFVDSKYVSIAMNCVSVGPQASWIIRTERKSSKGIPLDPAEMTTARTPANSFANRQQLTVLLGRFVSPCEHYSLPGSKKN